MHRPYDRIRQFILDNIKIIVGLQPEPVLGRHIKKSRKPQSSISRNPPPAINNFIYPAGGHPYAYGKPVLAHAERFKKLLQQNFTRVYRSHPFFFHGAYLSGMIIYSFHIIGVVFMPYKTYPPGCINADAALALSVAAKLFKMIRGLTSQIVYSTCPVQRPQLLTAK
jgi:hypothetical protein